MKPFKFILAAAVIVAAVAAAAWLAWSFLDSLETVVAWCEVEAPERVAAGETVEVTLRYRAIAPRARLSVDLHWMRSDGKPMGFLAHGGPRLEISGDGERRFRLKAGPREGMSHVRVVIYLGATGYWQDRTRTALSEPIPVMPAGTNTSGVPSVTHALFAGNDDEGGAEDGGKGFAHRDTPAIAALYLAAAVLCGWCAVRYRRPGLDQGDAAGRRAERMWCAIAGILIVLGGFAVVDLGGVFATLGRDAARGMGLYIERRTFQKASITVLAAAAALVACILLLRLRAASWSLRVASLGAVMMLGIFGVRSLSFHGLDALGRPFYFHFSITWLTETAVLILIGLAALVAVTRRA